MEKLDRGVSTVVVFVVTEFRRLSFSGGRPEGRKEAGWREGKSVFRFRVCVAGGCAIQKWSNGGLDSCIVPAGLSRKRETNGSICHVGQGLRRVARCVLPGSVLVVNGCTRVGNYW